MHGAYRAVGDVGSAWMTHVANVPDGTFTTGMLLRHPARILNSRLRVYPTDQSFTQVRPSYMRCISRIWGIDPSECNELDQILLQDAFIFASQATALENVDLVIRLETMDDPESCREALTRLTGLDYETEVVERSINHPVNNRSGDPRPVREILNGFKPRQRTWYEQMLGEILPLFGYALDEDGLATSVAAVGSGRRVVL